MECKLCLLTNFVNVLRKGSNLRNSIEKLMNGGLKKSPRIWHNKRYHVLDSLAV